MSSKNKESYSQIKCKRCEKKLYDFDFHMEFDKIENKLYAQTNNTYINKIDTLENTRISKNKLFCKRCGLMYGKKVINRENLYEIAKKCITEIEHFAYLFEDGD